MRLHQMRSVTVVMIMYTPMMPFALLAFHQYRRICQGFFRSRHRYGVYLCTETKCLLTVPAAEIDEIQQAF